MKLTQLLVQLGLLHQAPPEAPPPPKTQKRTVRLRELQGAQMDPCQDLGLDATMEDVYRADGLLVPGLETVLPQVASLHDGQTVALLKKAAAGRTHADLLREAQGKDAALDRYEEELVARVGQWCEHARKRAEQTREQARKMLEEADQLEGMVPKVEARLTAWRQEKQAIDDQWERWARLLLEDPEAKADIPPESKTQAAAEAKAEDAQAKPQDARSKPEDAKSKTQDARSKPEDVASRPDSARSKPEAG